MEQSLSLEHCHIADSRKVRILLDTFLDTVCLIDHCVVRLDISGEFADLCGYTEARLTYSCFIIMLLETFNRLAYHDEVECLRERCVVCTRTCHVDDAFLESYDLACCHKSHALECEGLAGSDCIDLGYPSREYSALALHLYARLDDILYRCDPYGFTRLGDVEANILDLLIFKDYRLEVLCVYVKDSLLDL